MTSPQPPGGFGGQPHGQAPGQPHGQAPGHYAAPAGYPTPQRPGMVQASYASPAHYQGPPVSPVWTAQSARSGRPGTATGMWVALGIVIFAAIWGLYIVVDVVGLRSGAVAFLAALLPLLVILAVVVWLDRWEPEPRLMLVIALLWGAGVSVVVAFYGNTWVAQTVYSMSGNPKIADSISAVVSAPIVEEGAKGLGVLLIFLLRRSYFDGVVDGIVYAAVVAAGFAFTENILYFGRFVDDLGAIFFQRGVMSPFAHVLFTACTGIALGIASRARNRNAVWWLFPTGLLGAMLLHALWNGAATLGGLAFPDAFMLVYLLVQVPLFIAAVLLAFWLRRQESAVIRERLGEYAKAGWFAPHEVEMVASLRQRSQARSWAGRQGPRAGEAMKSFVRDATSLAYLRQRALTGRSDLRAHSTTESDLLAQIRADRQAFLAATPGAA